MVREDYLEGGTRELRPECCERVRLVKAGGRQSQAKVTASAEAPRQKERKAGWSH